MLFLTILAASLLGQQTALATESESTEGHGNGIHCQARALRALDRLQTWIAQGGADSLDLQSTLAPDTRLPYTPESYSELMMGLITAPAPVVTCSDSTQIEISGECEFDGRSKIPRLRCNSSALLPMTDQDLVRSLHHALALTLPGMESDSTNPKHWAVSSQVLMRP